MIGCPIPELEQQMNNSNIFMDKKNKQKWIWIYSIKGHGLETKHIWYIYTIFLIYKFVILRQGKRNQIEENLIFFILLHLYHII